MKMPAETHPQCLGSKAGAPTLAAVEFKRIMDRNRGEELYDAVCAQDATKIAWLLATDNISAWLRYKEHANKTNCTRPLARL